MIHQKASRMGDIEITEQKRPNEEMLAENGGSVKA